VGMGILPLQFKLGQNAASLDLTGEEVISIEDINETITPRQVINVTVTKPDSSVFTFAATVRLDTPVEISYYANGGIMPTVLRNLLETESA
jgi:aconitate hydratase